MKKKAFKIIAIVLGVLVVIAGSITWFFLSIKKDQRATKERVEVVVKTYKTFSDEVDKFNDIRNDLYLNVFDNIYYETMGQSDASVKETLKKYEDTVDNIAKTTNDMKNLCGDIYFTDAKARTKCEGYGSVYEQIVNAFVSDIGVYNKSIDEYNDYQKEKNSDAKLEHYKTTKKYIDYNNDKKYEGKE